ncbi:MAG: class I SAM-dependent methyltransferase [Planctomycetes bacterium]|nr:class I SAM-dependent methyltransferase [Planctomycetota bacterium]
MGFLQRQMARSYDRAMSTYEGLAAARRQTLLAGIPQGARVLEPGPGTGVNLTHLAEAGRSDIDWCGVEPSPHMRELLTQKAAAAGLEPEWLHFAGLTPTGELEVETGSVDVVISTLVLCSVPDQAKTLAEVHRCLAPGGQFLFMEHVAAEGGTWTRRLQGAITPLWRIVADGCCLNRDTGGAIARAGFEAVQLEEYRMPPRGIPFLVRPHVAGSARR